MEPQMLAGQADRIRYFQLMKPQVEAVEDQRPRAKKSEVTAAQVAATVMTIRPTVHLETRRPHHQARVQMVD
jgi:hypothetical protein